MNQYIRAKKRRYRRNILILLASLFLLFSVCASGHFDYEEYQAKMISKRIDILLDRKSVP